MSFPKIGSEIKSYAEENNGCIYAKPKLQVQISDLSLCPGSSWPG